MCTRNGKVSIILPHGFLFKKTKSEYNVRRILIEKNYIEAIIGLPEKLFYDTKIPVVILLINKDKKKEGTIFIDASKEFVEERKNNILTEENQKKIIDTYLKYEEKPNYSYIASTTEIKKNNYDLSIKKYVKIKSEINEINREELQKKVYDLEREKDIIQDKIKDILKNI